MRIFLMEPLAFEKGGGLTGNSDVVGNRILTIEYCKLVDIIE